MTALAAQVVVLAKAPVPGRVKTRLRPMFTSEQAAALAEAALVDTLCAVGATAVRRRVLALDGAPGPWCAAAGADLAGFDVVAQRGDGLDRRMGHALEDAWSRAALPTLLIGMDTPQVTASMLTAALTALLEPGVDAVLGAAEDGGYWAIGLRHPRADLVAGIEMSTDRTGRAQLARLHEAGHRVRMLPRLRDVDTADDAAAVAAVAPWSCFALTWSAMVAGTRARSDEGVA